MTQSIAELPATDRLSDKKRQLLELMLAERKAARRRRAAEPAFPRADRERPLPLSYVQQRLWFLSRLDPGSPAYNIPAAVYLVGPLDPARIAAAYLRTVARHEDLRTNFRTSAAGEPFAVVVAERRSPMPVVDLSRLDLELAEELAQQLVPVVSLEPFDVERDALQRLFLVKLAPEAHVLLLVIHHIIADVWSIGVFFQDVGAFYDALVAGAPPRLPALALQYADYVVWQRRELEASGELDRQLDYWVRQLGDARPVIDLPTDFPRPPAQTFRGMRYAMHLGGDVHRRLLAIARPEEASLFMAALAIFYVLLYRYTGQSDLLVGTPTANRKRVELEALVGFFVNTVVLRGRLDGDPTFRQLLRQVRTTCLEAFSYQDLPFDRVVNALKLERDLSRNPLYQVDFAFQNLPSVELATPGLELKPFTLRETTSRFDLEFDLKEATDGFDGFIRYNSALFRRATIERMARHYRALLEGVLADPDRPISALPMLAEDELRALVEDGTPAPVPLPAASTAHALIAARAARTPEAPAAVDGGTTLSFAELEARANRLARHLLDLGTAPGEVVALAAPRRAEVLVAILAAWKARAAYLPLDPSHPEARLRFELADAGVRRVLATAELAEGLAVLAGDGRAVLRLDALPAAVEELPGEPPPAAALGTGDDAAYVIYTSGSTGKPKGVVVTHRGLVNYLDGCRRIYGLDGGEGGLVHSSLAFDLTVTGLLGPLAAGRPARLVSDEQGLDGLAAALRAAADLSVLKITPAHLETLGRLLRPGELAGRARTLVIGGEALLAETLAPWREHAPGTRLVNEYGPTETVVGCAIHEVLAGDPADGAVAIGRPFQNTALHVVGRRFELVPPGVPGELLIGGAGVARGYLGRPGLTAERFVPDPFGAAAGGRLYRSGDRVRRRAGVLDFLGRFDHQVKVRGYRIEPGEIEAVLAALPGVQGAAVLARDDLPGGAALVAYVAAPKARNLGPEALREALSAELPDYMVPALYVFLPALPLTANGKVDRAALPSPEAGGDRGADYLAPRTPTETQIARIWAEVLEVDRVSVGDRFFDLGGQSMLAVQVVSRIRDALQVEIPVQSLFNETTVRSLAEAVEETRQAGAVVDAAPIVPVSRDRELPLSFAQERLWFIDQLMPGLTAYHIPGAVRMRGRLDLEALEKALNEIIDRHEVLRTTFASRRGRPVQRIAPAMPLELERVGLDDLPAGDLDRRWQRALELARAAVRTPFDLGAGPLIRARIVELAAGDRLLVMVIHHIVYDMWSRDIFLGELITLYEAFSEGRPSNLPPLAVQYADYAVWQRDWLAGEVLARQLDFWRQRLAGVEPLELPADRPRGSLQSLRGARAVQVLTPGLTKALKRTSRRAKVTLFVALLSGFYALLQRYTGVRDLAIGSPIANRNRSETEALMGFFANTLVLRAEVDPNATVRDLLAGVRQLTFDAYAHQDLAFEKLVEELQPDRDLSRQPLFQVMFNFLINYQPPAVQLPDLELETVAVHTGGVPFDFTLSLYETEGRLHAMVDFSSELFDATTVQRMLHHYRRLLEGIASSPGKPLGELALLDGAERHQLAAEWNDPATLAGSGMPLSRWLEASAHRHPDAPAVVDGGREIPYRELNARANRAARFLRRRGVGPDVVVGVALERSAEMVMAVAAVLKAGGAYLPLDPAYPRARLAFMLEDAGCALVLSHRDLAEALPEHGRETLLVEGDLLSGDLADAAGESPEDLAPVEVAVATRPDHLGYVIYTSGSTGRPKGIGLTQRALDRLVAWQTSIVPAGGRRTLQFASLSFDASFTETFSSWATGGCLVMISQDDRRDLVALARHLEEHQIERAILPVVALQQLARLEPRPRLALREVIATGEALRITGDLRGFFEELRASSPHEVSLRNDYGPSETHVVTSHLLPGPAASWPVLPAIGRPIPGSRTHLLDAGLRPVPAGAAGEIFLGGALMARGYVRRPALTAAAFVPDPSGDEPGARLYRTGDLARRRADGTLEYLGRIGHQVKIRGFRVEPGEVQNVLERHPRVEAAAVLARRTAGDTRLVAYVVCGGGGLADEAARPDVSELRAALLEELPDFMAPASWVFLDALPVNANGKLDRRALPEPTAERPAQKAAFVAPRTEVEKALAEIWREVLGLERVGVDDNFFDLGGHSMLATQVMARLAESFELEVPLRRIFSQPTLAELAATVERQRWALAGAAGAGEAGEDEEEGEL